MAIGVGDVAPDFTLSGTGGTTYTLSSYRGNPVVLVFYPGDDTPVCTKQLNSYNNDLGEFVGLDATILGISPQDVPSHEKFKAKHQLAFPLLADTDKEVGAMYGTLGPIGFYRRSVFVIDGRPTVLRTMMSNEREEGLDVRLDFDKLGKIGRAGQSVLPVILQDADSGEVLFLGYANEEAYRATLERRSAVLWSTSRNELWHKGATSGDVLELVDVRVNCEQNSLLYRVRRATGGACHTKDPSTGAARPGCYYRVVEQSDRMRFTT